MDLTKLNYGFSEINYHIAAETKCLRFPKRHFRMHFLEWKCMNFGGANNNFPALAQPGDKPLSELMMVSLLTHICVTHESIDGARLTQLHNHIRYVPYSIYEAQKFRITELHIDGWRLYGQATGCQFWKYMAPQNNSFLLEAVQFRACAIQCAAQFNVGGICRHN